MASAGARPTRCCLPGQPPDRRACARFEAPRGEKLQAAAAGSPAGWSIESRPGQGARAMPLRLCRSSESAYSIESSYIFNGLAAGQPCFTAVSGAFPGCFCPVSTPFHKRRLETGATIVLPHQGTSLPGAAVCWRVGESSKNAVGSVAWVTLATPGRVNGRQPEVSTGHRPSANMASTERAASTRVDLPAASQRP